MSQYSTAFIVGCGHSGTSLMLAMIGAHPHVYAIPEETFAFAKNATVDLGRQIIEGHMSKCDRPQATVVVEKTPKHVHRTDLIRSAFPETTFIVMLRKPLDVVASIKRRFGEAPIGLRRWLTDNSRALEILRCPDCLGVWYENLVSNPAIELTRVCSFLGLQFDPEMLDYWQQDRRWFRTKTIRYSSGRGGLKEHKARRNWQANQPVTTGYVGSYTQELTTSEIALVERSTLELKRALETAVDSTSLPSCS